MKIVLFIAVVVFYHCLSSKAQILNIEKYRIDKDTSHAWFGNTTFGFSTKKQQTNVSTLNANSNLVYLSDKNGYMSINYIKGIIVQKQKVVGEGYLHLRANLLRKKLISYEPFVQYQYDLGRGLEKRLLAGTAFRLKIKTSDKMDLGFTTGGMYEEEIWRGKVLRFGETPNDSLVHVRFIKSTNSVSLKSNLAKNLNLYGVGYYQARFDRFFRPRVISDIQVVYTINRHFSISNQFISTYDALPLIENNRYVYSYNTNFIINF